ncbi:cytochrome c oxidase assembly factor CtaG [Cohnella faecalis]|uniref:Cytochrome c oxidase assembly factor CtaG n=1 Tax=Cohnella faecalis TaxID=2315694 RepID=A0A398CJC8_9BACL|nr:cytochrome c oxidase assembly factor CtaG [Cohnella faecalis]RIE02232.1 cytochrome c oxidase assembly factor CtaG [Cohnella faecalis]
MWGLEYFSFRDLWSPLFMAFMMAVAILYTFAVGPWREKFAGSEDVPFKRQFSFLLAIFLLYMTQGGPLSLLGHLMFSFHMTNMAISYVIVPPLLLYGIPAWLWRWMFGRAFWRPLRFLMNPLVGLFMFNLVFSVYHMPGNHDYIMTHYSVHTAYYVLLLISAMIMWWHIHCPVPEWARLTPLWRLGYIFVNGLLLTPACVLIIFANTSLFSVYNDPEVWTKAMGYCVSGDPAALLAKFEGGPAFFNLLSPRDDQQLGGIIMKLVQEFVNVGALFVVFMGWYRSERAKEDDVSGSEATVAPVV